MATNSASPTIDTLAPSVSIPVRSGRDYQRYLFAVAFLTALFGSRIPLFIPLFQSVEIDMPAMTIHALAMALNVRALALPLAGLFIALFWLSWTDRQSGVPKSVAVTWWVVCCVGFSLPTPASPIELQGSAALAAVVLIMSSVRLPWKSTERAFAAANMAVLVWIALLSAAVAYPASLIRQVMWRN